MNMLLILAFLFFMGSLIGWCIELIFRRFFSKANPERKWINPGFCIGPWIPLYGCGLCILFVLAYGGAQYGLAATAAARLGLFAIMAIILTIIEYFAGLIGLKYMHMRLWDYRNEWGNIHGLVCPKFTAFWWALSAFYYFVVHNHVIDSLFWLANHLSFSFFIGMFWGVFVIDAAYSSGLAWKIRSFAKENDVVVISEQLKETIRRRQVEIGEKSHFVRHFKTAGGIVEHLRYEMYLYANRPEEEQHNINAIYKVK
ncbi:MAG: putative ABC transporter permease [Eubacterium sp.]|nr:putative ABC transporter permease [Candidatus Colimonas fimequi]